MIEFFRLFDVKRQLVDNDFVAKAHRKVLDFDSFARHRARARHGDSVTKNVLANVTNISVESSTISVFPTQTPGGCEGGTKLKAS